MVKPIVCFMRQRIEKKKVNVDKMVEEDPEKAIKYIHRQYRLAEKAMRKKNETDISYKRK